MTDGTVHVRPNGRRRRRQSQRMSLAEPLEALVTERARPNRRRLVG